MNLGAKSKTLLLSSLLMATSLLGEEHSLSQRSFEARPTLVKNRMMPAYNAPAQTAVRGPWGVYTKVRFLYWEWMQDNMELGILNAAPFSSLPTSTSSSGTVSGSYIQPHYEYTPGFQIGLGATLDHDHWDLYAEYTRNHGTVRNTHSIPLPKAPATIAKSQSIVPSLSHPLITGTNVYNTLSSKWCIDLDAVDLELGRSYYVGTHLTMRPSLGVRSAWILQTLSATYENTFLTMQDSSATQLGELKSFFRSHSWGAGPRAGLNAHWIAGYGIYLFGSGHGDLLYTQYKVEANSQFTKEPSKEALRFEVSNDNINALRAHFDLELGLGWGTNFDNDNWHVDLSAAYGLQVFCNQNMFRHNESDTALALNHAPNADLYVQGLTVTLGFDY